MTERGTVSFGTLNIGFHNIHMPHPNIHTNQGVLSMFLAKLQKKCLPRGGGADLHQTGNMYSHEYIYHNDPEVDSAETSAVIARATNVVRANTNMSEFEANHVIVFTITGLMPKPCQRYRNQDGVSVNV